MDACRYRDTHKKTHLRSVSCLHMIDARVLPR
jgi:hypothetical protein